MFQFYSRDASLISNWSQEASPPSLLARKPWVSTYSRDLLTAFLCRHEVTEKDRVLVPDYLCNTVIDAIARTGAEVDFYPVDPENLASVPTEHVEAAITPETRAVLIVDYFGVPAQVDLQFLARLQAKKILTIRDAAHGFLTLTQENFTLTGWNAVITSPYKNVPCYVGGLLFSEEKPLPPHVSPGIFLKRLATVNGKKLLGAFHPRLALKPLDTLEERELEQCNARSEKQAMGSVWKKMLAHLDLEQIMAKRAQLCDRYDEYFAKFSGVRPLYKKTQRTGSTLMAYPLLFDHAENRNRLMDSLRKQGVDAFSWPTFSVRGKNRSAWERILLLPLVKNILPIIRRTDVSLRDQ